MIANLSTGGKLSMEVKVEQGRGYVPATVRAKDDENRSIGSMLFDASFSPIRKVSFRQKVLVLSSVLIWTNW